MTSTWSTASQYTDGQRVGVAIIASAGLTSILAILYCAIFIRPRKKQYHNTHVLSYYASLLVANAIQSSGTAMNFRWVLYKGVRTGEFCSVQGAIKHAGNIATAIWSLIICFHLFHLLFWRKPSTRLGLILTLVGGWSLVGFIVLIGPTLIRTKAQGPYFTAAGYWCWISDRYWGAQTYLEYFLMFVSAGLGLVLYTFILLRVRGNLTMVDGKWKLRHTARGQSWQLSIGRDLIDTAMIKVARSMVWYPVVYTIVILPIAFCRLMASAKHQVPFWLVAAAATVFNLTGFVNVMLLLAMKRLFPDASTLPSFTTPRQQLDPNSAEANGITPFFLSKEPRTPRQRYNSTSTSELSPRRLSVVSTTQSVSEVLGLPAVTHQ